ncbi:MAG TPA: glycosyltransferase family 4 protein [Hanamia sp.]
MKKNETDNVVIVFEPASDVHWMKDVVQLPNAFAQKLYNKNAILIARPNHSQIEIGRHIQIELFGKHLNENDAFFKKSDYSKIVTDPQWYINACKKAATLGAVLILYPFYGNAYKGARQFKITRWLKGRKAIVIIKSDGTLLERSAQKVSVKQQFKDRLLYFFFDKIICENQKIYEDMLINNPHLNSKLVFIPNCPLDIYHGKKIPYTEKANKFLFVGRVDDKEKGADILLNTWLKIANQLPNWKLEIAGPCSKEYQERWEEKFIDNRIMDSVIWSGPAGPKELVTKYNHAKIVVCSSRKESGPIVLSEAILSGCAFIGTEVGEIPFLLKGLEGIIDSENDMGEVMLKFARNESLGEEQSKRLLLKMKDRTWGKQVEKIKIKRIK